MYFLILQLDVQTFKRNDKAVPRLQSPETRLREINICIQVDVSISGVAEAKISNKMTETIRMLKILALLHSR
jgi:hypothetical protein